MGFIKKGQKCLCQTEASWSYAEQQMLCLDTSSWRTQRPHTEYEKCNRCGLCFVYCPTQCIREDGEKFTPDLSFCKGCGVCAKECPKGAVKMIPEGEYADGCVSR
jgi:2-oxoacid:acceptor oxidoreductase delta subunit (pyruvate/2-ketoisovalerate family)